MSINIFGHAGAARQLPLRASKFLTFGGKKSKILEKIARCARHTMTMT